MTNFIKKINPEWPLRLSLGLMYLYSGMDIIRHPTAWYWAIRPVIKLAPVSFQALLGSQGFLNKYLVFQGAIELILAFLLLAWFLPKKIVKFAAFLTSLEMAAILIFIPIDSITFRDIGLLGAAFTLFIILSNLSDNERPVPSRIEQERGAPI